MGRHRGRSRAAALSGAFLLFLSCAAVPGGFDSALPGEGSSLWEWAPVEPLPEAVANNAVAAAELPGGVSFFSFMGIGGNLRRGAIHRRSFRFDLASGRWSAISPVPGPAGRLGASAAGVDGLVYLFGGFTVDERLRERTLARLDIYNPLTDSWSAGPPMPVPVDDAVAGVWRNRLVYLIGGWSDTRNVDNVQVFDPAGMRWAQATPVPGPPVFGQAGAVAGDSIVVCGGVRVDLWRDPRFVLDGGCYRGDIDPLNPLRISWRPIHSPPGGARYRAAAGAFPGGGEAVFTGGARRPYNYNGVGYDGDPVAPQGGTWIYDIADDRWTRGPDAPVPTMDHRGFPAGRGGLYLIGGMSRGPAAAAAIYRLSGAGPGPGGP